MLTMADLRLSAWRMRGQIDSGMRTVGVGLCRRKTRNIAFTRA
jgi:hypothetical protein